MSQDSKFVTTESPDTPPGKRLTEAKIVKYVKPQTDRVKGVAVLARSDIMLSAVQLVKKGGETNLHAHSAFDGLWFVLNGRARFYGRDNVVLGEFGQHEGAFIPRGVPYWFESASEEPLEILQVECAEKGVTPKRIDYEPPRASRKENHEVFMPSK